MSGIVEDVNDGNYKEFTDSLGAVVAYGLATCEPCKTYDPILEDTAARFPGDQGGKGEDACARPLSGNQEDPHV